MPISIPYAWAEAIAMVAVGLYAMVYRKRGAEGAFRFWRSHRTANLQGYERMYLMAGSLIAIGGIYKVVHLLLG